MKHFGMKHPGMKRLLKSLSASISSFVVMLGASRVGLSRLSLTPLTIALTIQQKQKLLYWGCIGGVSTVLCVVVWNIAFANGTTGSVNAPEPTEKLITGAGRLNPQDAWNERITTHIDTQEKEIKSLRQVISALNETLNGVIGATHNRTTNGVGTTQGITGDKSSSGNLLSEHPQASASQTPVSQTPVSQTPVSATDSPNGLHHGSHHGSHQGLQNEGGADGNFLNGTVLDIPSYLSTSGSGSSTLPPSGSTPSSTSASASNPSSNPSGVQKRFRSNGISKQSIPLQNSKIGKYLDTVDNTIPPGSFAQGVLLSGVDAATSTSASANPEPVLIELTDSGDLSRYFTSTVKGCRITASSYGVLSKERVMMRLEKLSCIESQTGEVMVADVDGYISGEDGKLGLRGTVVDRAGDHVRAAMVGGFLSSFGTFLAGASNPVTFSSNTGLAQISSMSPGDMLKHGGSKGVSGALDKYTEFYIKRAEQLEPVIQVGAGRIVQVVFSKAVGIGSSAIKQAISKTNDRVRTETVEHHQERYPDRYPDRYPERYASDSTQPEKGINP